MTFILAFSASAGMVKGVLVLLTAKCKGLLCTIVRADEAGALNKICYIILVL